MDDNDYYADPSRKELAETEFLALGPTIDTTIPYVEGEDHRLREPSDRELTMLDEQRVLNRLMSPTPEQQHRKRVVFRWLCLSMNGEAPSRPWTKEQRALLKARLAKS